MNGVLAEAFREPRGVLCPPDSVEAVSDDLDHHHFIFFLAAPGRGPQAFGWGPQISRQATESFGKLSRCFDQVTIAAGAHRSGRRRKQELYKDHAVPAISCSLKRCN